MRNVVSESLGHLLAVDQDCQDTVPNNPWTCPFRSSGSFTIFVPLYKLNLRTEMQFLHEGNLQESSAFHCACSVCALLGTTMFCRLDSVRQPSWTMGRVVWHSMF